MNASLITKLSVFASAAVAFLPGLVRSDPAEPVTDPTSATVKVVYVVQTTTTLPPHIWISYDEQNPLDSVDVLLIQEALGQLGYTVAADGVYGPQTEDAVRAFQQDHNLFVDGIVGPVTARALGLEGILGHSDDPPPAPPSSWVSP